MSYYVALIQEHKINLELLSEYISKVINKENYKNEKELLIKYIYDQVKNHIKYIQVSQLNDIIGYNLNNDKVITTEISYSGLYGCYEIIYENEKGEKMNDFACLCSLEQHVIYNNAILIKNKFDNKQEKNVNNTNITKYDIKRIIKRRFLLSAILIENGKLTKYYYKNTNDLLYTIFNTDKVKKIHTSLYGFQLSFYYIEGNINEMATRLNSSFKIYGKCLVIHETEDEKTQDKLGMKDIKLLDKVAYGRLYDRKILSWNKYYDILNKESDNTCPYCNDIIIKEYLCKKCFRQKYCSEECYIYFLNYHYDECINK